jgi:hypothetical protein
VPELRRETDEECWERMISLQREYHCYKSARLEAAVEALERGCSIDEVPMREFYVFLFSYLSFALFIYFAYSFLKGEGGIRYWARMRDERNIGNAG